MLYFSFYFFLKDAAPSSIGIVFADIVPEKEIKRFERILSCYCDFRTYSPRDKGAEKPPRPPPPYQVNEFKELNQPEGKYNFADVLLVSELQNKGFCYHH